MKNDLPYSEGPKSIKVAAGKTATYVLTIIAKNSGIYHQTLTFTNKLDGSFLWYSIEVNFVLISYRPYT